MADKYLKIDGVDLKEIEATTVSNGASNGGDLVALNSNGKVDESMMPDGIGADTCTVIASEALSANSLVNIYDDGGTAKARKADQSNARKAMGYVKTAVESGSSATIYKEGTLTGTSFVIGDNYFLGTNGSATNTPPTTSGYLWQIVGVAMSATEIDIEIEKPIIRA